MAEGRRRPCTGAAGQHALVVVTATGSGTGRGQQPAVWATRSAKRTWCSCLIRLAFSQVCETERGDSSSPPGAGGVMRLPTGNGQSAGAASKDMPLSRGGWGPSLVSDRADSRGGADLGGPVCLLSDSFISPDRLPREAAAAVHDLFRDAPQTLAARHKGLTVGAAACAPPVRDYRTTSCPNPNPCTMTCLPPPWTCVTASAFDQKRLPCKAQWPTVRWKSRCRP